MRVLIIEDEKPASRKLIRLLKDLSPEVEIIDVLKSVEQSIKWFLANPKPDLVFMDIQLEDGLCFEIFENTRISIPVIFTTAYDEYTLQAFKVNSVDYLLKPVDSNELKTAIDKFKNLYNQDNYANIDAIIKQLQPGTKTRFLIKVGEHYKPIQTSKIHCFYVKERCNFILVNAGKSYPIDYSLDKVEQLIDSKTFYRISRNFIINFSAIQDIVIYSSNRLKLLLKDWTEKDDIIVSRERVAGFKEWMDR